MLGEKNRERKWEENEEDGEKIDTFAPHDDIMTPISLFHDWLIQQNFRLSQVGFVSPLNDRTILLHLSNSSI